MEGDLSYDKMLYTFLLDLFLCFLRFYVIMFCLSKENKEKRTFSLFFSTYVWLFFLLLFNRPRHLQRKRSRCVAQFVRLLFSPILLLLLLLCV